MCGCVMRGCACVYLYMCHTVLLFYLMVGILAFLKSTYSSFVHVLFFSPQRNPPIVNLTGTERTSTYH